MFQELEAAVQSSNQLKGPLVFISESPVTSVSDFNKLNQFSGHFSALPCACHPSGDLQVQQVLKVNYIPNDFANLFPDTVNWGKVRM